MPEKSRQEKIDEILGRAIRDREFRVKLVNNPKAAAADVGLTEEEINLVAGGMAIGNSLLHPGSVAYCTAKTCNEKGGARVLEHGLEVANPATRVGKIGGITGGGHGGAP